MQYLIWLFEQMPNADIDDVKVLDRFLRTFHAIASAPGGTAAFERHKQELFAEMDHLRDRFREGANLWVSPCFGGPAVGQLWAYYVQGLSGSPESPSGDPESP